MEHKKNILIVHNYYQVPGGEDTVVANERKMLIENGHEVTVYNRYNSELRTMKKYKKVFLPFATIFNLRTYKDIKAIIKKNKIEVVHIHNTLTLISPSVYYAAISCNVPVVQTIHNFRLICPGASLYNNGQICETCVSRGLGNAVKNKCYRNSYLQTLACVISLKIHRMTGVYKKINYIFLTEFTKKKFMSLNVICKHKIFLEEKSYVKPNFTYPLKKYSSKDSYYIYIGRLEEIKGVDMLIAAFSELKDLELRIVGTGKSSYAESARKFSNIKFLGQLDRDTLAKELSSAKALIVTSQIYETFGMTIIEAFSCGIPVIVGDIGNVGALVKDGITGFKFDFNKKDSLIRAIKKMESLNEENRIELCRVAEKEYNKYYSVNNNYRILEKIYEEISV